MKISALSTAIALTGFAQSSVSTPTATTLTTAATPSSTAAHYYLQIGTTSNATQSAWYGYIDPQGPNSNGITFQFTPSRTNATIFTLLQSKPYGTLLQGYKANWVAGSTNANGTAVGGAVHQADLNLLNQGGEPVVSAVINPKNAATLLMDRLGDGTVRNASQTCFGLKGVPVRDGSLPVLVVGERVFKGCNAVGLQLTPAK